MIDSPRAPYEVQFSCPDHEQELQRIDAWWRAANYLAVGMIYLRDNPLLAKPLCYGIYGLSLSPPSPLGRACYKNK